MSKVTSLSVHKNTAGRRRAKQVRDRLRFVTAAAQRHLGTNLQGYAVVFWDGRGNTYTDWVGREALGACPIDEFAKNLLSQSRAIDQTRDLLDPDDEGA